MRINGIQKVVYTVYNYHLYMGKNNRSDKYGKIYRRNWK